MKQQDFEMNRLAAGLASGMHVLHAHGENVTVTSRNQQASHDVFIHIAPTAQDFTLEVGWDRLFDVPTTRLTSLPKGTRVLGCTCEHHKYHGDHVTWDYGTPSQRTNGVPRCVHMLLAVWWSTSVPDRERLAARWPALAPFVERQGVAA